VNATCAQFSAQQPGSPSLPDSFKPLW
jgi:hypothetical protein